jgi:hypothetical protein
MSCTTCDDRITGFFTKAKELQACFGYNLTRGIAVGNTCKIKDAEMNLENIRSMSWLLSKHQQGLEEMCLCNDAGSNISFKSEEFINDTLDVNGPPTTWPELWKGVLKNTKSDKIVSLSSRSLDLYDPVCELTFGVGNSTCRLNPNTHKSLRFWEWNGNTPTLLFDTGEIFNGINSYEVVSFYYSELHDSYFVRVEDNVDGSLLFKISADFSSVVKVVLNVAANPQPYDPQYVICEVADSLNYIFVNTAAGLGVYSLANLALIKTINTAGVSYQKITWDNCNCTLFLTGGGDAANAVIHVVDVIAGTITNLLNSATLKNNTSIITNAGKLLVLTSDNVNNQLVLQKWSSCAASALLSTTSTGINMGLVTPGFITIHTFVEDEHGNIFIVYLPAGGSVSLSVFDKDFNLKYTRDLNWGTLGNNINNSWSNTNISNGFLITHRIQQNGVNGTETYYLELENLDNPKPKCISLTDEEVCDMVEKINSITC